MKKSLTVPFVFAALAAVLAFAAEPPESAVFKGGKLGKVTFPHKYHAEVLKIDCAKCHHTLKEGEGPQKCTSCHGVDESAPAMKDAAHKVCKDCHKEMNASEGKSAPAKCKDCHVK